MLMDFLVLIVFGGLLTGGVLAMQADRHSQFRSQLVAYELQFPYGIKPEAVTDFLVGLTGLVAPRYLRWLAVRNVVWETVADHSGISHRLLVSAQHTETVLATLRAHLPGVRTTALAEVPAAEVSRAKQLGLSHAERPLAVHSPVAVSAGILAAMQPLEPGEQLVLQWTIQPAAPAAAIAPATQLRYRVRSPFLPTSFSVTPRQRTPQDVASERAKHAYPLLLATPRIGVLAQPDRAAALLRRMTASFHAVNAAGVHFFVRLLPSEIVVRNLTERRVPLLVPPCALNAAELGPLLGVPLGEVTLPGLRVGQSRLLAPSIDIPRDGRVVAQSTFPVPSDRWRYQCRTRCTTCTSSARPVSASRPCCSA